MMYNCIKFFTLIFCLGLVSCYKEAEQGLHSIYQLEKYDPNRPIIKLGDEWERQAVARFPEGLQFYKSNQLLGSRPTRLNLLVFRPSKGFELKPVLAATAKTTTAFYNDEPGTVYAAMNAGYFTGATTSLSLVVHNSVVSSDNTLSLSRSLGGVNTAYYPTRAAFGMTALSAPSVAWVYNVTSKNINGLYYYERPLLNEEGSAPLPRPSVAAPQGGQLWNVSTAIGGSPMLIKDSVINVTDVAEMITASATTGASRPRSAIGHLANGNIVMVAVEGGSEEISGLTLAELAKVMLSVGCVGAINLDGGGSTSMVVDGELAVKPSDAGGERRVVSALVVKKK